MRGLTLRPCRCLSRCGSIGVRNYLEEGLEDSEDKEGIEKSMDTILKMINAMESDFKHIFLGGFSMGGGLALHALAKASKLCPKVRGIFTMGSYLVNDSAVLKKSTSAMQMEERATKDRSTRNPRQAKPTPIAPLRRMARMSWPSRRRKGVP